MRRSIWMAGVLLIALLIAMLGALGRKHSRLSAENARLRAALAALETERADALQSVDSLKGEIAVWRMQAAKVPAAAPSETQPPQVAARQAGKDVTSHTAKETQPQPPASKRLESTDLPAAVQTALAAKAPTLNVQQIDLLSEDGQWIYQVQGMTADGRRIGLRLAPDGTLQSAKSEMTTEALPGTVRDAVAKTWGDMTVLNAREIIHDNMTAYELGGWLADGRKINLSLAPEGTLLQSETEVFQEHLPQPVQRTISDTAGPTGTPSIKEVYRNEQLMYQVALKSETGHIQMLIGNDGTLIEFNSRMAKPKPQE